MADDLVIYAKVRTFKAKATYSRPRLDNPKAKALGPRINNPGSYS